MAYRVIVCGSRTWQDPFAIQDALLGLRSAYRQTHPNDRVVVISGGARGADYHAKHLCRALGFEFEEYPAEWDKYGKFAGPVRNRAMLATKPDLVLAYRMLGKSNGTDDMVAIAIAAGVPTRIYHEDGTVEYR